MIDLVSLIAIFLALIILVIILNLLIRIRKFEDEKEFYNLVMFGVLLIGITFLVDLFSAFNLVFNNFGFIDFTLITNIVKVFLVPLIALTFLASVFIIKER
ncbi:MAG: hypothetical protein PHG05_04110 [Candidatus Nanoarchaeia archaeon]|nr:hypothetical protein [Candidatus Nanoarchaeia archaeon]